MLAACLRSLEAQSLPHGLRLALVVVDNEVVPTHRAAVEAFNVEHWAGGAHYVHEPVPGIPQARNAALTKALEFDTQWIAFIDDDEEAGFGWVSELHAAAYRHGRLNRALNQVVPADVVWGPVYRVFPSNAAKWRRRGAQVGGGKAEGAELSTAVTNNVIFNARLVRELDLRFANELQFVGTEDTRFFRELHSAGARIIWSFEPVVYETVPWERITLRANVRASFRKGIIVVSSARAAAHFTKAKYIRQALRRVLAGTMKISIAPLALILGPSKAMHAFDSGCRNVAEAAGLICGLRDYEFRYYERTTGF